jgi:hypothetical protein
MPVVMDRLKTQERRRSQRIPLRMPILVEGRTAEGKPFEEKTYTLEINRHGARIVLLCSPQPGGRIAITNLQTKTKCPFQVVNRPGKPLDKEKGADWAVECLDPQADFWGISFPEKEEPLRETEGAEVLLECAECRAREQISVTQEQYRTAVSQSSVRRECRKCAALTEWRVVRTSADLGMADVPRPLPTPPPAARPVYAEQRREKRLPAQMPVRIRLEEIGETENLSPSGLCIRAALDMKVGDRVGLTVGYTPGGNQTELTGRIVWRKEIPGSQRNLYGVKVEPTQ